MFRQTHWSGLGNYDSMMMLEWNISLSMCVCATDTFSLMLHFALQSGASAIQSKTKNGCFSETSVWMEMDLVHFLR